MTPEELYAWINSLPGKTFQQKLNLAQDLAGAYNIDLFGANEPFVPETYVPQIDTVSRTWGMDPVAGPIFTAIDQGMSPAQAVQAARENPQLKDYFPGPGEKGDVDWFQIANDYANERLTNLAAEQQFQMGQANKQAIYEGKQPFGTPGVPVSMYDVAGQPSLDELMNMYVGGLDQFRDQGRTDLSQFAPEPDLPMAGQTGGEGGFRFGTEGFKFSVPRPGLPNLPDMSAMNVARGVVGTVGGLGPKFAVGVVPSVVGGIRGLFRGDESEPVDLTGGESPDEIRMRQEYARSRVGAGTAKKKMATQGFGPDAAHSEWQKNLVRELAYRSIAGMANTPVGQTDRDRRAAAAWDMLQRYGSGG